MELSRRMIQRLTRAGGIRLNGRAAFLARKVRSGDTVAARTGASEQPTLTPVEMPLSVLYEDHDLLVIDKGPGLLVHPTHPHHRRTLAHGIAHYFQERGLSTRVRPIHRLDRDTTGAVLIAKSAFAHQHLDRQLRSGTLVREYLALVEGGLDAEEGTIEAPIARSPGNPSQRMVSERGQRACTHFRVEQRCEGVTLVRASLVSGRTHQLRVHFAHLGHPLLGDRLYGARLDSTLRRYALHSARLEFALPGGGGRLVVEAPVPSDLAGALSEYCS